MKKLLNAPVLIGTIALLVLLVVGSVGAGPLALEVEPEIEPGGPGEHEPEPGGGGEGEDGSESEIIGPDTEGASLRGSGSDPENPSGTAVRINFEVSGHSAVRGLYILQEPGGDVIASWYALDGWLDSGWINDLEIGAETVLVDVLYYPGPETEPTKMRILNPAPGTEQGWLGRGMAHALEVAWPDMPVEGIDENL